MRVDVVVTPPVRKLVASDVIIAVVVLGAMATSDVRVTMDVWVFAEVTTAVDVV